MLDIILTRPLKPKESQIFKAVCVALNITEGKDFELFLQNNYNIDTNNNHRMYLGKLITGYDKKEKPIYLNRINFLTSLSKAIFSNYEISEVLEVPARFIDFINIFKKALKADEYIKLAKKAERININKARSVDDFLSKLSIYKEFDCDIETRGFDFRKDPITLIGVCYADGESIVLPMIDLSEDDINKLRIFFENTEYNFYWTNGKFDTKFFKFQYQINARVDGDLFLMSYALDERKGVHNLGYQASFYLNVPDYKNKIDFETVDIEDEEFIEYNAKDVCYQRFIRKIREEEINLPENASSLKLYKEVLLPANELLTKVEMNGFHINANYAQELDSEYRKIIDDRFEDIVSTAEVAGFNSEKYKIASKSKSTVLKFNPKSPKQLAHLLLDILELPQYKSTRTTNIKAIGWWLINKLKFPARSYESLDEVTEEEAQEWLSNSIDNPKTYQQKKILYALISYRKYVKLHSTYINVVLQKRTEFDRVHSSFNLGGTVTGRLSSSGPNLQNIPRNKKIKNLFSPAPGNVLVEVDYSQAELRVLAELSKCPIMIGNYRNDKDLHDTVASQLYGPDFTKEQRVGAKTINFGLAYGRGVHSVAEQLNIDLQKAQKLMDDWFNKMPVAGQYIRDARQAPYDSDPVTIFGRMRRFGLTTSQNANKHENEAVNFPIQSTASDLTLLSAIRVQAYIEKHNFQNIIKIVNIIHDAILVECPKDMYKRIALEIKQIMENTPKEYGFVVPFKADMEYTEIGWGSKQNIEI